MNRILTALLQQNQSQEARTEFQAAVSFRHNDNPVVPWETMFQFPLTMVSGLRAQPFWENPVKLFGAARHLAENHDLIQQDLQQIPENAWQLQNDGDLVSHGSWTEFMLLHKGVWHGCDVAPQTCRILRGLPEVEGSPAVQRLAKVHNQVSFLRLNAGSRLRWHTGPHNARLILHLGLIVSKNAGITVGNFTRRWHRVQILAFDDSFAHEAWNDGSEPRIVLYTTIWHPDLQGMQGRPGKGSARLKSSEL